MQTKIAGVLLMDRSLWPGEWLRLSSTDFDFKVEMTPKGGQSPIPSKNGVTAEARAGPRDA